MKSTMNTPPNVSSRLALGRAKRLSTKLIVFFLLLSIIPLAIVGYLAFDTGRRTIEQDTRQHLVATTILKEAELNRWIENSKQSLRELASRPHVEDYAADLAFHKHSAPEYQAARQSIIAEHLQPILEQEKNLLELFLIRASDGLILVSTNEKYEGQYRESDPYFVEGKKHTYVKNVYYSLTMGETAMTIGTPVTDRDGNLVAVLAGRMNLAEMSDIMRHGDNPSASEETYMVNSFNFFISESRFEAGYALKKAIHTEGVKDCLQGHDGVGLYTDYRGVPVIGAYRWISERELCILTEVDQAEAFGPIVTLRNTIFGVAVAVALMVVLLAVFFARTITKPLRQLVAGAGEIGRGNMDYRIELKTRDEIGLLARAFDQMAADLETVTASRDELNKEIAERKRAEEQLLLITKAVESTSDAIGISDPQGRHFYHNQAFTDMFEYETAKELQAAGGGAAVCNDAAIGEKIFGNIMSGESWVGEHEMITKSGRVFPALEHADAIKDEEGSIIGLIGIITDISTRVQAERELKEYSERLEEMVQERTHELQDAQDQLVRREKLAVMGQLAGSVAHELRNPLGAVKNSAYFLNMLLEGPDPKIKTTLEIIDKEVETSERIISSLLDFARDRPPARQKVNLNHVVREALARVAVPDNVEVMTQLDETLPSILADPDQLGQVFGNLILNAIQAMTLPYPPSTSSGRDPSTSSGRDPSTSSGRDPSTSSGRGTGTPEGGRLNIQSLTPSPGWVAVSFSDTGVGIPPENLDKLFEPLFTTKAKGIGLGLALVKNLIENHKGRVEVQSKLGKGSTFTVSLPIQDVNGG